MMKYFLVFALCVASVSAGFSTMPASYYWCKRQCQPGATWCYRLCAKNNPPPKWPQEMYDEEDASDEWDDEEDALDEWDDESVGRKCCFRI